MATSNLHNIEPKPLSTQRQTFTKLAVAAIDFGTTYSGFAYSFRGDYIQDPLKIFTDPWRSDEINTEKTPTCILFDKDKNFHSFGYDAESKYADLAEEEEHSGWRYFKHFKMLLMQTKRLKLNVALKDDQGERMLAKDVFSASIKYLKDVLLKHIQSAVKDFKPTDLCWVLTVPAIWDDGAKQFMREAAKQAEIENEQLILALEPEAAAIFCKEIAVKRVNGTEYSSALSAFDAGSKFLLLDLGGGTVDITVELVEKNGSLTEIHPPDGGPWGGTLVDQAFREFLVNLLGTTVLQELSTYHKSDELFLFRNFEAIKRKIGLLPSLKRILRIPANLLICAKGAGAVKRKIEQSKYKGKLELKGKDKLAIDDSIFRDMFAKSSTNIVKLLKTLFGNREIQDIRTLILVGGFSESALIANEIRNAFPDRDVIVPREPSLAVLKGAVLYGHDPNSITSRKMKCTYGISTAILFDDARHPEEKKVIRNGIAKCEDVFEVFLEVGQTVIPDITETVRCFNTSNLGTSVASVEIYMSREKCPQFISDDGCMPVGTVVLELDTVIERGTGSVEVMFLPGHTELKVEARQSDTNNMIMAKFNFLR